MAQPKAIQLVVLEVEFDDRAGQLRALLDAEALAHGACGDVAYNDLQRDHFDCADQLFAHVQPLDEVGRHADARQTRHEVFGQAVVQHALALDQFMLFTVSGSCIVLEELDQGPRLRSFVEDLSLAFVNHSAARHNTLRTSFEAVIRLCRRVLAPLGAMGKDSSRNPCRITTRSPPIVHTQHIPESRR